jgi:3-hydroxybutyryl-CoA dehydratase
MKIGDTWEKQWEIDPQMCNDFISLSGDNNPMHTNTQFAQSHGFKEKVVHGNILNTFLSFFVGEMLPMKNVVILGQSIKYFQPLYANNQVKLKSTLTEYIEAVAMYDFSFVFEVGNQKIASGKVQIKTL